LDAVAAAITVAAFLVRAYAASRNYLNPDEATHYVIATQPSLWLTYKASLTNAHPPLIYLIVYGWRFLGRSELMLRMPSVLAGTAACRFGFKWMRVVAGEAVALVTILFLAFSSATVMLSSELRAYALLLACVTAALYFLARAFERTSPGDMFWFSVCLCLAIVSHYSAVFFAVAAGLYALARFSDLNFPRRLVAAWIAGQAGALALCGFLYVTHISKVKNYIALWGSSFTTAYFDPTDGSVFRLTAERTSHIFQFLFGQKFVAGILLLCFLAAIAILFRRDLQSRKQSLPTAHLGILLLFPFLAVWIAAVARVYPFVGSRHTALLAPFAIAGASFLLATILRQRLWAGLVCVILLGVSYVSGNTSEPGSWSADNSRQAMIDSAEYMRTTVPRGDHVLVDFQTSLPFVYYFCGSKMFVPIDTFAGRYFDFNCNGNPIVSLHSWKAIAPGFPKQFEEMAHAKGLQPGDRVWFYQAGWGEMLDANLDQKNSRFRCLAPRHFGSVSVLIPFVVGPDFQPAAPSQPCPS
jgi:uncharacterized membrane protein